MIKNLKKNVPIVALLVCLFLFLIILNHIDPVLLWDENVYLANARSHISTARFTEDFRFPLIEYILAGVWFFTGESVFIAKLVMIIFTVASVYIFYLITQVYTDKKNALIAAILFSASPLLVSWGFKINTDIPAMFFMTLSYYLLIKGVDYIQFLAGIVFGLSFLTKFPFALFGIAVLIGFILKKEYKKSFLFLGGFLLTLIPWLLYNYLHYATPIWDFIMQWSIVDTYTSVESIAKHGSNLLQIVGPLIFFAPFGVIYVVKEKKNCLLIFIYSILFIAYYFFITKAKIIRYYFAILPFLYLLLYLGILKVSKKINKQIIKKIIYGITGTSVFFLMIIPIISIVQRGYCEKQGATLNAINYIETYKNNYTAITSNIWPYFGYYNNVYAYSLWTDKLDIQLERYKPQYVIYHDRDGLYFNKTKLDQNKKLELKKEIKGFCDETVFIYAASY